MKRSVIPAFFFLFVFSLQAQTKWTLRQCIDLALEKNIYINQNKLTNEINKLTLEQSKANRIPNLNLSDGQSFSYGRSIDPSSNQFVDQNVSSNNVALNTSVNLFSGFQNENTIKQNKVNYDAGNSDVEVAKNEISLNVVAAYLQVLLAYEQVDNAKSQIDATTAQVDRTKKYVDVGKFPESNLLQIQSQLATDKFSEVIAENQLQNSKVTLMQLIELPMTDSFEIEKPNVNVSLQPSLYSSEEIYKIALGILPQVTSATLKTQSATFGLKIARSLQLPKLTLGGSLKTGYSSARDNISYLSQVSQTTIGYLQSNPSELVSGQVSNTTVVRQNYPFSDQFKDNFSQVISLNLAVPIFNNRQAKTGIEKAKVNTKIAELNEQNIKNQLRKNVEQVVTDLKAAEKKYAASNEQFTAAELSYRNMEKKFSIGLVNSIDFLTEKNNYTKAVSNQVQSKYDYLFKIKVVDYYLGKPLTF